MITLWRGRPREAVEWLQQAVADGEAVGAKEAVAHALLGLHRAFNALGESDTRTAYGQRALALHDELGDLVSKGGMLNNLGADAYYEGRWNEAFGFYRRALEALEQAGDTRSVSGVSFNIGEILSAQGNLSEAEPLLRRAERVARASAGATEVAEIRMETALLEARQGNIARAPASSTRSAPSSPES